VLDVGCATGTYALALAAAGFHVTGLDISRGMLARARAKAGRAAAATPAVGSVRFARCNLEAPPPPSPGTYAVALCAGVLQCAEVPVDFLAIVRRALGRDGVVLVEVKDSASAVPPATGHSVASRVFAPLKRWASESRAVHSFTRDRLEADLRAAGLRIVDDRSRPGWLRVAARAS